MPPADVEEIVADTEDGDKLQRDDGCKIRRKLWVGISATKGRKQEATYLGMGELV